MSVSRTQKNYWTGAVVAGAAFAILFGILAGNSGGSQGAYIGAAVVCGLIAVASLVVLLVRR